MVKSNLLNLSNGFSENKELITSEDYDLWIRISKFSEKFKYINKSLGFYNLGDNESGNSELSYRSLNKIYNLYIKENTKTPPIWFLYLKARYLFLLKKNKESFTILKSLLFTKTNSIIKIKTLYMFLNLLFKSKKISL